jgi:hypothetical protein
MRIFRCISKDLWILCLWPPCCPIPKVCHEWVFVVHILLVNLCEQAYEYVFNENSTFQMVGSTRSTPNVFDTSGSGDLPPPPPMTPVETFMATQPKCCTRFCRHNIRWPNWCNRDLQWELIMMDHRWLPPTLSLSGWSPQHSLKQKSPLMLTHGLGP